METVGGTAKAPVHRYSFPPQETELRGGEELRSVGGQKFGQVEHISLEDRCVDIKKRKDSADKPSVRPHSNRMEKAEVTYAVSQRLEVA